MSISDSWRGLILGITFPALVGCALTPTAPWLWGGELACHWGAWAAFAALPAVALWAKVPVVSGPLLVLVLVGAAPSFLGAWSPRAPQPPAGEGLTVAWGNHYIVTSPVRRSSNIAALLASDPDLVGLAEVNQSADRPGIDAKRWPHQYWLEDPRWHDYTALLSRHPISSVDIIDHPHGHPFFVATVEVRGRRLSVVCAHTESPRGPAPITMRNEQIALIASTVRGLATTGPVLVMGDLNVTPASPGWAPLVEAGLERPISEPATWHAVLGPYGIPIDHILGVGLAIAPPTPVDLPYSDHRGLITRVAW